MSDSSDDQGKRKKVEDGAEDDSDQSSYKSEDEETLRAREEEEIRKHQIAMAKREAQLQAKKQKPGLGGDQSGEKKAFGSSKGFLSAKAKDLKDQEAVMRASFQKQKEGEALACPYKSCGRSFVSDAQLKAHVERRHKSENAESGKKPVPEALKKAQGFET